MDNRLNDINELCQCLRQVKDDLAEYGMIEERTVEIIDYLLEKHGYDFDD